MSNARTMVVYKSGYKIGGALAQIYFDALTGTMILTTLKTDIIIQRDLVFHSLYMSANSYIIQYLWVSLKNDRIKPNAAPIDYAHFYGVELQYDGPQC